MTTTVGTSGYINSVTKMDKTTAADGTLFDAIHQQLLNNDAFLNAEIMGMIQKAVNSGVIDFATPTVGWGIPSYGQVMTTQNPPTSSYAMNHFRVGVFNALINGYNIFVDNKGAGADLNEITLDPPPTSNVTPSLPGSARDDLVLLEQWFDTTGAIKSAIRKFDGIDFATYPEGINHTSVVKAQGGSASATTYTYSKSTTDSGLYIAGDGSSAAQSALGTLDGYVYAIVLFRVRRRNNAGFDPDNNPMGNVDYWSASISVAGSTGATTVTVSSVPSNVQVGDKFVWDGSASTGVYTVSSISGNVITFTPATSVALQVGHTLVHLSDRPDGLYSNIIDATDIVDLRHQVPVTGIDKKALLNMTFAKQARGQLITNATQRYGRDYIGLNTGSYTDDANSLLFLNFDGTSINGTANGASVTGSTFYGSASFVNGVQGLGMTGADISWALSSSITTGTIECFYKTKSNSNDGTNRSIIYGTGTASGQYTLNILYEGNGQLQAILYDGTGSIVVARCILYVNHKSGEIHYIKVSFNGTTLTLQSDEQITSSSYSGTAGNINKIYAYAGDPSAACSMMDLIRVSNIVRTGTPLPSNFSYANGDRILDGANSDFTTWSDDVGGTTGVNGRTNPYGLSRVPNQIAGRISYNGQEIRHYYGNGVSAAFSATTQAGTSPTGSFEQSAEYVYVNCNETVDGTRTTFTFSKPANANGLFAIYTYGTIVTVNGSPATPLSISIDSNGTVTATLSSAPASGVNVHITYMAVARHAHFIPSTKGFVIHDWTDDQASGTGSQTVFQTTKYNVTSINHVRVGGVIQNGGYSTSGSNANTTLTASAAVNATTITVASASNFVANQNIRISNGDGTWYTTTITSVSGNTLTVPALTKALSQNATVQGAVLVTFTTAPASGTNNIDIVYESVLTPQLGDYIRILYQHLPYQGLLGSAFAGSGTYKVMFFDEDEGFVTTLGSGSNVTASVPAWAKDYAVMSAQLPINGNDYQLKKDTITFPNNPVTGVASQLAYNEQLYELNASTGGNMYSPLTTLTPTTQTTRGMSVSGLNDGTSGRSIQNAIRDLSSAIPHLAGMAFLVMDTSTGELLLGVATMLRTDATNKIAIDGSAGAAFDVFKLAGRPLIKAFGGVAA